MKYNPNFLSEYQFADDDYSAKFRQPENAAILINSFTLVAVFISCMGLFGLAAYTAENKTKEIGIRKILGASVTRITVLLVKEFVKPVMIAIVIASPLAWIFMNFFLSQFSYRTGISWWILVIAGSGALFIALFTVSFQSVRAAIANPVKNLRAE
jgi:ABC-type antimicrobial peptide transport system permease subunit